MAGLQELKDKLMQDESFAAEVMKEETPEACLEKIRAAGFEISAEDVAGMMEVKSGELDDDDLDDVNGGFFLDNTAVSSWLRRIFGKSGKGSSGRGLSGTQTSGETTLRYSSATTKGEINDAVYRPGDSSGIKLC